MQLSRRNFFTYGGGALAIAGGTMMNTACWFSQNVFDSIIKYVGVGLQAFTAVVSLLSGSGVINPVEGSAILVIINLVKAGFADLQTAVTNYENAPAADKQTLLGKISTALAVLEGTIQQFWNDVQLPNASLAAVVEGLLGIILSTLSAFASQLPAPAVGTVPKKALAKLIVVPAKKRTPKQFKKDFNAVLVQGGYAQYQVN